ncbi:MAG: hypothetical protein WA057_06400 [Candidatus Magasanikiibacteriota bacterium]
MIVFGWLKKLRERKVRRLEQQEAARAKMRQAIVAFNEEDSVDPVARINKVVPILQAYTTLADAFDPGWRQWGKCDLTTIPELHEFRGYIGVVFADCESLFD